jgi:dihydroflavonol-4-reductase
LINLPSGLWEKQEELQGNNGGLMILVTGASGLLGGNLVRALRKKRETVRCMVHRDTRALDGLDVEIIKGDVRSYADVAQATAGVELVYHLAGYISLDGDRQAINAVNIGGVRNVVQACLGNKVRRLVHFSSIHALSSKPRQHPITESNARVTDPRAAAYDFSKAVGERVVREGIAEGLDAVILNPTGVIGPLDYKPSMFGQALLLIARGFFPVLMQGGFNWVDARDVAECAIQAAELALPGSQYIVGGEWRSVRDIAEAASRVNGGQPPKWYAPIWLASVGVPLSAGYSRITGKRNIFTKLTVDALKSNPKVSDRRARIELGYSPRPFEETIRDTVTWFSQNRMLPPLPERKGDLDA